MTDTHQNESPVVGRMYRVKRAPVTTFGATPALISHIGDGENRIVRFNSTLHFLHIFERVMVVGLSDTICETCLEEPNRPGWARFPNFRGVVFVVSGDKVVGCARNEFWYYLGPIDSSQEDKT